MKLGRGFTDSKKKFHPTGKSSIRLHPDQVNLKSAPKSLLSQIKQQNIDSQGKFSHNSKKIPLEKISIFNLKNKQFILKGTNPSTEKTVTKIVKLN